MFEWALNVPLKQFQTNTNINWDGHTIKPGTPEHVTTQHGTPAEHRKPGITTEHWRNNRNTTE